MFQYTAVFLNSFVDLPIQMRRAVALYGVGKLIQMESLTQACEDSLVIGLNCLTVIPLLQWAERQHGSAFISRHCINFIRVNFVQLSRTGTLNRNGFSNKCYFDSPIERKVATLVKISDNQKL